MDEIASLKKDLRVETHKHSYLTYEKQDALRIISNLEPELRQLERNNSTFSSRGFRP